MKNVPPLRYGLIALCLFSVTFLALQPLTAHAGITSNLTYILCGDASTFTNDIQIAGQWQHVTAGEIAYDPSGNAVAANGYAQQGHIPDKKLLKKKEMLHSIHKGPGAWIELCIESTSKCRLEKTNPR